ncbi:MAG: PilZ domain-containing protein [Acidobacteriota bacterium]
MVETPLGKPAETGPAGVDGQGSVRSPARAHRRFKLAWTVKVVGHDVGGRRFVEVAPTVDVSLGGLSFISEFELRRGDVLHTSLLDSTDSGFVLRSTARVVHVQNPDSNGARRVGAQFIEGL